MTADQLLKVLWRRRVTFLVTFVLVLGAAAAVTAALPKVYTTTAYLLVTQSQEAGSAFEAVQVNELLTRTYAELLQTRNIAEDVAARLGPGNRASAVQRATDVSVVSQSQLLSIKADGDTPLRAQQVANTYAQIFLERVGAERALRIAERAPLVASPSRPQPRLYLLVGALVALFLATAVALLRHRLDQRLEVDEGTTDILGLPIIARISQRSRRATRRGHDEAFRFLLVNLSFAGGGRRPASVAIVSAAEGEGKSTTSLNLAIAAAELGISVALVDADLRRPSLARMSGIAVARGQSGLSTFLAGEGVAISELAIPFEGSRLHLIPPGPLPPNPAALVSSPRLADVEIQAREQYDLVIYDTPPVTVGPDASLLVAASEVCVLVVDPAKARRTGLSRAVDQLRRTGGNVVGVALNRIAEPTPAEYYIGDSEDSAPAPRMGGDADPTEPTAAGPTPRR
jgi:polysaccharide biosynthesis transport protein